jgi:ketosteroid isomerase-like protein
MTTADDLMAEQDKGAMQGLTATNAPEDAVASDDLDATIAAVRRGVNAFTQGDPMPQNSLWSKRDDITLANPLGPPRRGWSDVEEAIERAAAEFRDGTVSFEEVSRVVTADLAYLVEIERFSAKVSGRDEPSSGSLRVTMIFRRESDVWKIVHRHADTITTPRPAESVIEGR